MPSKHKFLMQLADRMAACASHASKAFWQAVLAGWAEPGCTWLVGRDLGGRAGGGVALDAVGLALPCRHTSCLSTSMVAHCMLVVCMLLMILYHVPQLGSRLKERTLDVAAVSQDDVHDAAAVQSHVVDRVASLVLHSTGGGCELAAAGSRRQTLAADSA